MVESQQMACAGTCNRGKVEGEARIPGDPVWCQPCQRRIRSSLAKIDQLCTWLESQSDGFAGKTGSESRNRGKSGGSASISPSVELIDTIFSEFVVMEREWRQAKGLAIPPRVSNGRTAYDRALAISFLQVNMGSMLAHPKMIKPLGRIVSYAVVLGHFARAQAIQRDRPGRCPKCHTVNVLYFEEDDELIHCKYCRLVMTEARYDAEVVDTPDAAVVVESRKALGLEEA